MCSCREHTKYCVAPPCCWVTLKIPVGGGTSTQVWPHWKYSHTDASWLWKGQWANAKDRHEAEARTGMKTGALGSPPRGRTTSAAPPCRKHLKLRTREGTLPKLHSLFLLSFFVSFLSHDWPGTYYTAQASLEVLGRWV